MRKLLVIVFLVSLVFSAVSHLLLPDEVATHFGWGGRPDSWGPKGVYTMLLVTADVIIFLICFFLLVLFAKTPKRWINLPNKDFWLSEKNIATTRNKVSNQMLEFGVAIIVFIDFVKALSLKANLSDPVRMDERQFFVGFGALMVFAVVWCVRIFLSFRMPENLRESQGDISE